MWLDVPTRESLPPDQLPLYDRIVETRGFMPSMLAVAFHSPELLSAVAGVGEFFRTRSALDPHLRELVILAVAREVDCDYEWAHHARAAVNLGVDREQLERVAAGALDGTSLSARAVRYARRVAMAEPVDDALIASLRRDLGDGGILELTFLASYYVLLGRAGAALQVELEEGVAPPLRPTREGDG